MVPKKLKIALPISSFLPNKGGAEIGLHYICRELKNSFSVDLPFQAF